MTSNFRIRFQRDNGNLHINLRGDFDGTSAQVLLDALKRNCDDEHKIFVHTNGLNNVYPFARGVLKNHLPYLKGKLADIIFTGKNRVILVTE